MAYPIDTDAILRKSTAVASVPIGDHAPYVAEDDARLPYGGGLAAFKTRPPASPDPGKMVNTGQPWAKRFIPPLALFNDASQWVNRKYFVRPMPWMQNPDSNPVMTAQYFTPPPINIQNLAAGQLNLQLQLGTIANQTAALTVEAANWYGG